MAPCVNVWFLRRCEVEVMASNGAFDEIPEVGVCVCVPPE